jgi:hypothetical protein
VVAWLDGLPVAHAGSRLRNGLVGSGFIFIELHDSGGLCLLVRQLDYSFFSGVSGSYTVTVPLLRLRKA